MDRNAARNSRVAARGHGVRVVRGLLGGRKFSWIKPKFRVVFGHAEATRSDGSGGYISMRRRKARGLAASIDRTSVKDWRQFGGAMRAVW